MTLTNANVPRAPGAPASPQAPAPTSQPAVAVQTAPPKPQVDVKLPVAEVPEAQLPVFDQPMIRAVPLSDPDFDGIKPKNPAHKLYWANRGHQNGLRVGYRQAQGFRLANKNDVLNCPEFMIDPTGQIVNGDRVLMIIGKNAYEGALLNNHNKAIRRGSKFGQISMNWVELPDGQIVPADSNGNPIDVMQATLNEVRATPANKAKIKSFVPAAAEINAILNSAESGPQKP